MKKVLFIAYFFPPLGSVAVQRALRYIKYLPSFGWQPHVLTVTQGAEYLRDESLLTDIPKGTPITRTQFVDIGFLSRLCGRVWPRVGRYMDAVFACFPPDRYVGWLPFAYQQAKQIIDQEGINVLYTVSVPYTAHLVGYLLKRRTGKPWVADFRDEWTKNPFRQPRLAWQGWADSWLERQVLETADQIIVTTEPYQISIRSLLPACARGKVEVITNGFEKNDFVNQPEKSKNQQFRLVYVGSFYGSQEPSHFLEAVRRLMLQKLIDPQNFQAEFVGRISPSIRMNNIKHILLSQIVRQVGFVGHRKAIEYMLFADVLLLIVSSHRGSGNIPAKTFEYIAANRPILALVPPNGAAAELIQRTRTGVVVPPEDVDAIAKALLDLYSQWNAGTLRFDPDWAAIEQYEGWELTKRLSSGLNSLVDQQGRRMPCE